ncbi:MAG: hypothetical protein K2K97_06220, partial [Muribaculaceae bacterium]|nr:hypothetical protein [Muribaculaceae bacterium]
MTVAAACVSVSATAQNHSNPAGAESRKSFQEFRKGLLSDFKDFRERLLDQYADFLNGEWHEYESLKGEVRDKTPKPKKVPTVSQKLPERQPENTVEEKGKPESDNVENPGKELPPVPGTVPGHKPGASDIEEFAFYGLPVALPKVDYNIRNRIASTKDYGSNWSALKDAGIASKVIPNLKALAEEMNLNDYLLFRLTESYVNQKFPDADSSARFSLTHYLLANMGYDVRIAVTTSGCPLLLIPFKERVYARTYMRTG